MVTVKNKNLKIALAVLLTACLCIGVYLEYAGVLTDDWFWFILVAELLFDVDIVRTKKTKRNAWFLINALGENEMLEGSLTGLLGKNVEIKTLDDNVSGVVKSIDGDFLILEKDRKKAVETFYVNKNTVETVKIVKQK